jgi:hypothetical protein
MLAALHNAVNPNLSHATAAVRRSVASPGAMLMPGNIAIERATNRADLLGRHGVTELK